MPDSLAGPHLNLEPQILQESNGHSQHNPTHHPDRGGTGNHPSHLTRHITPWANNTLVMNHMGLWACNLKCHQSTKLQPIVHIHLLIPHEGLPLNAHDSGEAESASSMRIDPGRPSTHAVLQSKAKPSPMNPGEPHTYRKIIQALAHRH